MGYDITMAAVEYYYVSRLQNMGQGILQTKKHMFSWGWHEIVCSNYDNLLFEYSQYAVNVGKVYYTVSVVRLVSWFPRNLMCMQCNFVL